MSELKDLVIYLKSLKLLYVEDNEGARVSTNMVLKEFFTYITVAIDGQDGFDKFNSGNFDIIITDINMPKLSGIEMTKKIRDINKDIPILILSAHNELDFFMESIKLGIEGYLLKPIDLNQFLETLDKVTQRLKLSDEVDKNIHFLKEYQDVTNHSSIVSKTDLKGIITYANEQFCAISEYKLDELIGKNHNIVRHPDMPKEAFEDMWNTIKDKKQIWKGIVRNKTKNGKSYYVDSTVKPILDMEGNIVEYIALRNDITDIMNPKKQLDDAIKNTKEPLVVYMKLEEFKILEEFYDNTTIEQIQDEISIFLEKHLSSALKFEKIFQLGNGEYAMVNEKSICMEDEDDFIDILKMFQDTIKNGAVDINDIHYDMSVIISVAYNDSQVLESSKLGIKELLHTKHNLIISNEFAQKEKVRAQKNMQTISMIKKALTDSKIISHFQPIVNNKTQQIEKYESLVRLVNDDDKVLAPFFFLDVAKKSKYYSAITNMVLDNSFSALQNTNKDISINLSALDIEFTSTREKILELLSQNEQYAHRIVIELLEDESAKDFKTISSFISDVKDLGVKIAIDDFGAGYSNFERLLDYQPDILKIDGCLIRDIETNSFSLSVVKTIIAFAKEQNIQTVAEYVENENIYNILKDIGVDYSQGYYFGKPEALK